MIVDCILALTVCVVRAVVIVVVNAALLLRLLGGHELMASFMAACMGWAWGLRFVSLRFASLRFVTLRKARRD